MNLHSGYMQTSATNLHRALRDSGQTGVSCVWTEGRVLEFPVIKIAEKDIVDTNGAGDAFVGGK